MSCARILAGLRAGAAAGRRARPLAVRLLPRREPLPGGRSGPWSRPGIEGRAYTVTNARPADVAGFLRRPAATAWAGSRGSACPCSPARALAAALGRSSQAVFPRFEGKLNYYRVRRVTSETTYDISRTVAELGYRPDDDFASQFAGDRRLVQEGERP
ncbi:MAG: hypothetical protein M0C28_03110 [Candidatus Moduliflexus flocculans]|nr:hypothetical protein [Candidatus Moduliflexus flocculans]